MSEDFCPFEVGDKVVCIGDFSQIAKDRASGYKETFPVKGEVYTVREVVKVDDKVGIRLQEIHNPILEYSTPWSGVIEDELFFIYKA